MKNTLREPLLGEVEAGGGGAGDEAAHLRGDEVGGRHAVDLEDVRADDVARGVPTAGPAHLIGRALRGRVDEANLLQVHQRQ